MWDDKEFAKQARMWCADMVAQKEQWAKLAFAKCSNNFYLSYGMFLGMAIASGQIGSAQLIMATSVAAEIVESALAKCAVKEA